jgi:hypothetical protein
VELELIFRNKDSKIGTALKRLFGLPYITSSDDLGCFIDKLMSIKPKCDKIDKMLNYIFENNIISVSRFHSEIWAECSYFLSLTTND